MITKLQLAQQTMESACKRIDELKEENKNLKEALAKQEQGEPVVFKIYKPTPPRHAIPNVRDAELPWVYDQDPSSGNVASMWVTPVQTLRSKNDR